MDKQISEIGEFGLINRIAKKIKVNRSVIKGIGDDAAVVKFTKDKFLLLTTDLLIEDIHFTLKKATAYQIGWKSLASNISDIAAMGGVPKYGVISMGLPKEFPIKAVDQLYTGIRKIAAKFNVSIVGGDTSRSNKLVINVALVGEVKKENLLLRNGAEVGDIVFVTGFLGGSGSSSRHLNFVPRIKEAQILVKNYKINSMIDLSDGLASDLAQIAKSSQVGAIIYERLVPISKDANSFHAALTEGEDFELLFTLPVKEARRLNISSSRKIEIPITQIGEIVDKKFGIKIIGKDGYEKKLEKAGFRHF